MRSFPNIALWIFLLASACGTGSNGTNENQQAAENQSAANRDNPLNETSIMVATLSHLPDCTKARAGSLAYVKAQSAFFACDGVWAQVVIKGDKGDPGVPGIEGRDGAVGRDGVPGLAGAPASPVSTPEPTQGRNVYMAGKRIAALAHSSSANLLDSAADWTLAFDDGVFGTFRKLDGLWRGGLCGYTAVDCAGPCVRFYGSNALPNLLLGAQGWAFDDGSAPQAMIVVQSQATSDGTCQNESNPTARPTFATRPWSPPTTFPQYPFRRPLYTD
jgi:hypothetical protein